MDPNLYLMCIVSCSFVLHCVFFFTSYCLCSGDTCHPLPEAAQPVLLQFHTDLLDFALKLFQGELYSISSW